jgi:hypothetical protein
LKHEIRAVYLSYKFARSGYIRHITRSLLTGRRQNQRLSERKYFSTLKTIRNGANLANTTSERNVWAHPGPANKDMPEGLPTKEKNAQKKEKESYSCSCARQPAILKSGVSISNK